MSFGLSDVTVRYGSKVALDGVMFLAPAGAITTVVGGDGAGKTTLLGCFTGMVLPTHGTVDRPAKQLLGVMPSTSGTWRNLTVDENIEFAARAYGIAGGELTTRRVDLLEQTGLAHAHDRLAGHLSGGMRQKLGFLLAILHDPTMLVLDEPTTGVDPVSRLDIWRLISEAAAGGASVAMATTYLDEAERSNSVLVLDAGHMVASGAADDVIHSVSGTITVTDRPSQPERAWRRGRHYHEWHPDQTAGSEPVADVDLEDAVIAEMLQRREQDRPAVAT
jgi:ABC-2 type transport system ATP-binding protein